MDIVEEIRNDPEKGARRLESEYKAGLMALARRFCPAEGDAEELVNSTFAEVVASIDRYAEQSAFFAWMARILIRRHGHDTERKSNQTVALVPEIAEDATDPDAESRIFSEVDASILRDAIHSLPQEIRNTVVMHYFMDIPVREAANVLNVPTGTIAWRLHYARILLAAKLGAAAKKPGGKALLLALALCGLTALGAAVALVGDAAFSRVKRNAAGQGGGDLQIAVEHPDGGRESASPSGSSDPSETAGSPGSSDPSGPSDPSGSTGLTEDALSPFDFGLSPFDFGLSIPDPQPQDQSMNATTRTAALCAAAIAAQAAGPVAASGRTVYDAGKALRQNCESGSYANPYPDADGGVWSYLAASSPTSSGVALEMHAAKDDGKLDGWHVDDQSYPKIMVNVSGQSMESAYLGSPGYPIEADELILHPGDSGNAYAVLRFTVPQDGWYSAFASFHDISNQESPVPSSGVDVHVTLGSAAAGDTELVSSLVTLESVPAYWGDANRTQRFDYQMPARYLTQGMRIQFVVGPKDVGSWAHMNDGTGVKALVVKEDEGRFYDSGVAFTTNVLGGYVNPYGTAQHGTWHALLLQLGAPAAWTDFQSWIPQNLENSFEHAFTVTFPVGDGREGFKTENGASEPYVLVNPTDGKVGELSPRELCVHPPSQDDNRCTVVRFRTPEAGRYSASVVARYLENGANDGVEVFLVAADKIITNSVVSGDHVKSTMHLTFDNLLLAAAEPVDIIVSPRSAYWSDATAVSAIFRREDGAVYDANKSFYAHHEAGNTSVPFDDVLGGGAQWSVGSMTGSWLPNSFAALSGFVPRQNSNPAGLSWWEHSPDSSGSQYPRIAMTTNAIASFDNTFYITHYPQLAIAANEIFAHPAATGQSTSCAAVRAIVPSNGVYRVRGRARDLDNTTQQIDGIRFTLALGGYIPATSLVQMNYPVPAGVHYEESLEGDRLWLKAEEVVDAVVDPETVNYCDSTGLGLCYEREGDGTASVVNVDFTDLESGAFSATRGREGYSDWLTWNALQPGSAAGATVENCYEADGTTRRNVSVTLARTSGAAIAAGSAATGTPLLDSFVTSSGADDAYAFTISKLKANEPYTLYLYSANGNSPGNAAFTVGGATKGVEGLWMLGATPMLTRFDVVSDAHGEITGSFAAADGSGGAFNGLTLVGELPDYKSAAFVVVVR